MKASRKAWSFRTTSNQVYRYQYPFTLIEKYVEIVIIYHQVKKEKKYLQKSEKRGTEILILVSNLGLIRGKWRVNWRRGNGFAMWRERKVL